MMTKLKSILEYASYLAILGVCSMVVFKLYCKDCSGTQELPSLETRDQHESLAQIAR